MRTTVVIDDDVLLAAKAIARERGLSIGKVLSDLARQTLARQSSGSVRNGVPLFPIQPGAGPITLELVNRLRDGP
jgi:hypothetical protein